VRVRTADERGITLQTLIVTAVLVLMAVAAGVVIVAITNSASDDLEEQTTSIDGNCNAVEVYDPTIAAGNNKGRNAGVEGSAIGCIPACIFKAGASVTNNDHKQITSASISFNRAKGSLAAGTGTETNGAKAGQEFVFATATSISGLADTTFASGIAEVRVAANQRSCLAYNSQGNPVT